MRRRETKRQRISSIAEVHARCSEWGLCYVTPASVGACAVSCLDTSALRFDGFGLIEYEMTGEYCCNWGIS
ncbi:uncharacterized protein G2W53_013841 [Senna tora]|uniref:Uncharacterized protein n=1 Tax=Senna tora TaxID=362788 RepID=A0A834TZC3_9FABA|nr:uncharacterized protein G2W53_013841 [Senna tora]